MKQILKNQISYVIGMILVIVIISTAFLRVQMDDEEYFDLYDFEEIPEEADGLNGVVTIREDMGVSKNAVFARIAPMHLRGGKYRFEIEHEGDSDYLFRVSDRNNVIAEEVIRAGETKTVVETEFPDDVYNLKGDFIYNGSGTVTLKSVYLRTDGVFYTDTIIYAFLLVLLVILLLWYYRKERIADADDKKKILFVSLIFFAIIICYPIYSHYIQGGTDFDHHLSRIENIRKELLRGQFPVVIYPEAFRGKGGLGALYPSVFLYFPAVLRILGMSVPGAFKVFEVFLTLLPMLTGWYCIKRITGDDIAAALGSVLFTVLPYRILVFYFRDAVGEAQAVVFIPLIIAGLYDCIFADSDRWKTLSIGVAGTIASHTLTAGFAGIICILFGILFIKKILREKRFIPLLKAVILCILLSLWTLFPFLYYYGSDIDLVKWLAVRDFSRAAIIPAQLFMVTASMGSHSTNGLSKGIVNEDAMSLGYMGLICILIIMIYLITDHAKKSSKEIFALILFIISCWFNFMSTSVFPWATLEKISFINNIVRMIQFPTRFQSVGLSLLVASGIVILFSSGLFKDKRKTIVLILLSFSLLQAFTMMDSFLGGNTHMTTKFTADLENEFLNDYVPYGFEKHLFKDVPEADDGEILSFERKDTDSRVTVGAGAETEVRMPLVFFKGYRAYDGNGNELPLYKGDYGEICVRLPSSEGERTLLVGYELPLYFTLGAVLSILAGIYCLLPSGCCPLSFLKRPGTGS